MPVYMCSCVVNIHATCVLVHAVFYTDYIHAVEAKFKPCEIHHHKIVMNVHMSGE